MKKISVFLLFILLQQTLFAQNYIIPLWPKGKVPNYQPSSETEKRDTGRIISIRLVQEPDIAVYLPAKQVATGQAVIICPGGGYSGLAYNLEGTDVAGWLVSKGIAAIVLKYRLPNSKSNIIPHLSPLMDAKRAMRMVRFNAARWNINAHNIGIMGFSAGGHLASTLATHFDAGDAKAADSIEQQSSRPDFAILVYPVITMTQPVMHVGSRNNLIGANPDTALARFYSNELQVTKDTPPTFLVHAMDDNGVPVENSLLFFQAMKNNGVTGELHVFPKGGHGFGLGLGKGEAEQWTGLCTEWMRSLTVK
ncbi:alpha/beta hydrolase [Parafilimonas sp.]|uniref:alpha/beta hydrolase n=1 Tax=Parafilimonas sp. TaxID=1969739 RepID=UPI0039E4C99A